MELRAFPKGAGIVIALVAEGGVWRARDQAVFRDGAALARHTSPVHAQSTATSSRDCVRLAIVMVCSSSRR